MQETGIGSRIRQLRIERGLSVKELADKSDISVKFMYKIESEETGFSTKILLKIASALHVSCDYILTGHGEYDIMAIMKLVRCLNDTERQYLEKILLGIVKNKTDSQKANRKKKSDNNT